MPKTNEFKKIEHSTIKEYGKKKGESVAYAVTHKLDLPVHKSEKKKDAPKKSKEDVKNLMEISGVGLMALAVTPTPDDVTIISPLLQFTVGAGLFLGGLLIKK